MHCYKERNTWLCQPASAVFLESQALLWLVSDPQLACMLQKGMVVSQTEQIYSEMNRLIVKIQNAFATTIPCISKMEMVTSALQCICQKQEKHNHKRVVCHRLLV